MTPGRSSTAPVPNGVANDAPEEAAPWLRTPIRPRSVPGKRALDVTASALGLLLLGPLLLLVWLLVRLDSPGPALFRQRRVGLGGATFDILKFRTMRVDAERRGGPLTVGRDPRITRVGRVLRASKIDELPQLVNVLRGEMSLVGPRPEVPRYVARYDDEQLRVLSVRPGITDLASIEFRDENALLRGRDDPEAYYLERILPRKLELGLRYVERSSVPFDLRIILRTLWRVVRPERTETAGSPPGVADRDGARPR